VRKYNLMPYKIDITIVVLYVLYWIVGGVDLITRLSITKSLDSVSEVLSRILWFGQKLSVFSAWISGSIVIGTTVYILQLVLGVFVLLMIFKSIRIIKTDL
jgi:hypothetical protein